MTKLGLQGLERIKVFTSEHHSFKLGRFETKLDGPVSEWEGCNRNIQQLKFPECFR